MNFVYRQIRRNKKTIIVKMVEALLSCRYKKDFIESSKMIFGSLTMGRPQAAPYFYSKANQNGSKDRYILSIMDKSRNSGYKKLVFHASKREAGLKAKELYDDYIKKNTPVPGEINKPTTVLDACKIFISRREAGRKEVCQTHSIEQVSARFRNHLLPFLGQMKLSDLSVEYVIAYKKNLDKKGLAGKTVQYCIDEAREFFEYCVEVGWMEHTPFDSTFKMAKPKPKKNRIPDNSNSAGISLSFKFHTNKGVNFYPQCFL